MTIKIPHDKNDYEFHQVYGKYPSALEREQWLQNKAKKVKWTRDEE